jgi:hypothetical protein
MPNETSIAFAGGVGPIPYPDLNGDGHRAQEPRVRKNRHLGPQAQPLESRQVDHHAQLVANESKVHKVSHLDSVLRPKDLHYPWFNVFSLVSPWFPQGLRWCKKCGISFRAEFSHDRRSEGWRM